MTFNCRIRKRKRSYFSNIAYSSFWLARPKIWKAFSFTPVDPFARLSLHDANVCWNSCACGVFLAGQAPQHIIFLAVAQRTSPRFARRVLLPQPKKTPFKHPRNAVDKSRLPLRMSCIQGQKGSFSAVCSLRSNHPYICRNASLVRTKCLVFLKH